MKKIFLTLIAALVLVVPAFAQDGPPPGGGGAPGGPGGQNGPSAAQRAAMQKYRPVFDLVSSVRMMLEVDKQKGLAFNKNQAKTLLPILKNLGARPDLKPADAEKILSNIEDKILTPAQLKWMDAEQLKRDEERRKRFEQAQANGGTPTMRPPGFGNGQNGQGNGNRGPGGGGGRAMFEAISQGKPFNPFKDGPGADNLKQLLALLTKR